MTDKLISTEEAREILPVSYMKMRRLLRDGKIRGVKVDTKWLVYEDGLREYIESNTNTPCEEAAAA